MFIGKYLVVIKILASFNLDDLFAKSHLQIFNMGRMLTVNR